ncbi:hypothetical protein [Actinomadura latina]|uniref:Uncharacterized protein n=1 Tax=Actinomadura latina TaxID=163603 RepID=A0A846Z101_9ACTN|nr:hypothetical protein [Actinomadura latina]NKZ05971.1 hypothetical protein [Actinomadura latina]
MIKDGVSPGRRPASAARVVRPAPVRTFTGLEPGGSMRVSSAAAVLAAVLLIAQPAARSAAREAGAPLGKSNFAVAVGALEGASRANWVRLGRYAFAADGGVSAEYWSWRQQVRVRRSSTGNRAQGCAGRDCTVLTASGWQSADAARTLTGGYDVHGDELHIAWDDGHWEKWRLTSLAGGEIADLELAANDLGATHGFGDGSNASWDARVPAATIAAADHTSFVHRYDLWKTDPDSGAGYIDHGDGSPFWVTRWKPCRDGRCLGARTHRERDPAHTVYYVAPADTASGHRRDTLWHWRTALADARHETCYTGNSHVKPMIQIVDDDGGFHGWVGVEASLNQTTSEGRDADDIGVFRILG